MTGSLTVKNGTFYIVLNYTENGKRKRPWISTGLPAKGNKRKAEQLLQETLQQYRQAKFPKADIRFSDYIRRWLTIVQRKVDEVTYQGYKILADTQILPYFDFLPEKTENNFYYFPYCIINTVYVTAIISTHI